MSKSSACPSCKAPVDLSRAAPGRVLRCTACRAFLRVDPGGTGVSPLRGGGIETPREEAAARPGAATNTQAIADDYLAALKGTKDTSDKDHLQKRISDMMANRNPLDTYDIAMLELKTSALSSDGGKSVQLAGPYRIVGEIGRSPRSVVHRVKDTRGGSDRALKILPSTDATDTRTRWLFDTEMNALRTIEHPSVVRIYEAGEFDGRLCYAMELVEGSRTLADVLRERVASLEDRLLLLLQAMEGVAFAHSLGTHHGNLKPTNVLIDERGARVSDFALHIGLLNADPSPYLAPEQDGSPGVSRGPSADSWAFGVLLYQLLTGGLPARSPRSPRKYDRAISPSIEAICLRALEPRPADRYPNAAELAADLSAALAGDPVVVAKSGLFRRLMKRLGR